MKAMFLIFSLTLWQTFIFAHGGKKHSKNVKESQVIGSQANNYTEINEQYLKNIKPIFRKKCLDCHGKSNLKPWYYAVPGAKQFIDHDIEEAKEHMDMSNNFPFGGHGEPVEDLEEIREVIEEESMPPWQYKLMHWSSTLTKSEKDIIKKWITISLTKLKQGEGK